MEKSLLRMCLEKGSGQINIGGHRGIFIAPKEMMAKCPAGWIFLESEFAKTHVEECLRELSRFSGTSLMQMESKFGAI